MPRKKRDRVFRQDQDGTLHEIPESEAARMVAEFDRKGQEERWHQNQDHGRAEFERIIALPADKRASWEREQLREWRYRILSTVALLEKMDRRSPEEKAASLEETRKHLRDQGWSEEDLHMSFEMTPEEAALFNELDRM